MVPRPFHPSALSLSSQEESTKYFNFSTSDQKSTREAEHRYRVRGQGESMSAPLVGTEGAGGGRREKSWEREPGKGGDLGCSRGHSQVLSVSCR